MSHKITTQTSITEKTLALSALKTAGWAHSESGDNIRVTSGPMSGSTINLKNGTVSGDSDHVNKSDDSMGALKRYYGEAKFRKEALMQGIDIENREVEAQTGDIILHCNAHFA